MSREQLEEIFAEVLGVPLDHVTDSLTYESIPEWDSYAHLDLIAVLEETYSVVLAAEIAELRSLADAIVILGRHGVISTTVAQGDVVGTKSP